MKRGKLLLLFIFMFVLGFLFSFLYKPVPEEKIIIAKPVPTFAEMKIPAIDREGRGVLANLVVEVKPGDGKVLTDIENILFWADTQESIRVARKVAENFTAVNLSEYDLIYKIEVEKATLIGGESAGAALALTTIAALQNKTLNKNISITGAIDEAGSIKKVGAIKEKAQAVYAGNMTKFLVPPGQGTLEILVPKKVCEVEDSIERCEIKYERKTLAELGPEVIEVTNIKEAAEQFGLKSGNE